MVSDPLTLLQKLKKVNEKPEKERKIGFIKLNRSSLIGERQYNINSYKPKKKYKRKCSTKVRQFKGKLLEVFSGIKVYIIYC